MAASRFLFVHGAWHGAWSFDLVRLELERRAVSSEAVDLPGLGDDTTPIAEAGFQAGVDRVIERIGTRRNWTLVGHSLGGLYVTEAALRASGKVRSVFYVAAWVPSAGDDFKTVYARARPSDGFKAAIHEDPEAELVTIDPARAKEFLYHDVVPGIAAAACTRLRPQPREPLQHAKIDGTADALAKIPRKAIVAERDRVLRAEDLVALAERAQVPFEMIATGHCPFLSAPKQIADLLLGVK